MLKAKQESEATITYEGIRAETVVWTERMLAALVNGVKGGKWFSLWDKVWRKGTLERAWELVRKNKGASGIDGLTIGRFEKQKDKYLRELQQALQDGEYKPEPVKRIYIPKGDGGQRPLGIACVKDRIIQTAVRMVMEPIFEKEFLSMSYGFRPGRGAKDALRAVDALIKAGYTWVVDADIRRYFDSIPRTALLERVREHVADGKVLKLVKHFMDQEIMEECKRWTPIAGTAQGSCLSPLLANIYLHDLDLQMTAAGYQIIRYADDYVVLCRTEEEAKLALAQVRRWMEENGLELHSDKTHVGDCRNQGDGFEFLGYRFEAGKRTVRESSLKKLRDAVRKRTKRTVSGSIEDVINSLNPTLIGWFGYFKHAHKWTFSTIDGFVRRRLRAILRRRNKRSGMGFSYNDHKRWPNAFFAAHGLFTMKEAYGKLASQSR